jgi:hypothetical protein
MKRMTKYTVITGIILVTVMACCPQTQAVVREDWSKRIFSPTHGHDLICGIAADPSGNAYFGWLIDRNWQGGSADYCVGKMNSNGELSWIRFYDGPSHSADNPSDFKRDRSGNLYITGSSWGNGIMGCTTIKYNANGDQLWLARYEVPGGGSANGYALEVDSSGNVYVAGLVSVSGQGEDFMTLKYSPSGVLQWAARYDSANGHNEEPSDLAVDQLGNVYVTGWENTGGVYQTDYLTVKYNTQGVRQWVATYDGPGNELDMPHVIKLDGAGNAYITGLSKGDVATGYDFATIKYNPAGVQQWVQRFSTPQSGLDEATNLTIDADNNIIVIGYSEVGALQCQTFVTLKYRTDGSLIWERDRYLGCYSYGDRGPEAVITDRNRNVYITGEYVLIDWIWENVTLKYDALGNLKWMARHVCDTLATDGGTWGKYITLQEPNTIFIGGEFCFGGDIFDHDVLINRLQQTDGDVSMTMIPVTAPIQIPATGGSFSYAEVTVNQAMDNLRADNWWKVIRPDPPATNQLGPIADVLRLGTQTTNRSQRVPGSAPTGTYQYILNVGEYPGMVWASDTLTFTKLDGVDGVKIGDWGIGETPDLDVTNSVPASTVLLSVSPNPFNPTTTIRFNLPEAAKVTLEVFDINGRVVGVQHVEPLQTGNQSLTFDGAGLVSGVYIYRLTAGEKTVEGKLILMK